MPLCEERRPGETMRRRGGRPRLSRHGIAENVTVRLEPDLYNAACRKALHDDVSVSEIVRTALKRDLGITV